MSAALSTVISNQPEARSHKSQGIDCADRNVAQSVRRNVLVDLMALMFDPVT